MKYQSVRRLGSTLAVAACSVAVCTQAQASASDPREFARAPVYTLRIFPEGRGAGRVTGPGGLDCIISTLQRRGTCDVEYAEDELVMLTAVAATGSEFVRWRGPCVPDDNRCEAWMGANRDVYVGFTGGFRLTVTGEGSGHFVSHPGGIYCDVPEGGAKVCSMTFGGDVLVNVKAEPAPGWVFGYWTGPCTQRWVTCRVWMNDADRSIHAVFFPEGTKAELLVRLAFEGEGTVTVTPPGVSCTNIPDEFAGTCDLWLDPGTIVRLEAEPAPGSRFGSWSGPCTPDGDVCVVEMNDRIRIVDVLFTAGPPALHVTVAGAGAGAVVSDPAGILCDKASGTAALTTCAAEFQDDALVMLEARPAAGSALAGWLGACAPLPGARCVAWMDSSRTVRADFTNGAAPAVHVLSTERIARALLGGARLSRDEARVVDRAGNRDGRIDLADLVAWRDRVERKRPANPEEPR